MPAVNFQASVQEAAAALRVSGIVPGSVRIELPRGMRSPCKTDPNDFINAAELLWAVTQLTAISKSSVHPMTFTCALAG